MASRWPTAALGYCSIIGSLPEALAQPAGAVRRDSVDARLHQAPRCREIVHRPSAKLEPCRSDFVHELSIDREGTLQIEPVQAGGFCATDQRIQRRPRVSTVHDPGYVVRRHPFFGGSHCLEREADQRDLFRLQTGFCDDFFQGRQNLDPALDLDQEALAFRHRREDIGEGRDLLADPCGPLPRSGVECLQFAQRLRGDWAIESGDPPRAGVVKNDNLSISRQPDVEFVGVRLLCPTQMERGERVFRCVVRSAAMTNDFDRT